MILEPLALAVALAILARATVRIYAIPSRSMAPTLEAGDQIVVTPYVRSGPQRGDIVIFRSPEQPEEMLVKRVIGVPGDWVDSRLGRVRVGGHTLAEPYVLRPATSGAIPFLIVPSERYFVLGDNREDSVDSRSWGLVPRDALEGRARLILWSASRPIAGAAYAGGGPEDLPPSAVRRARLFKWIE